MLTRHPDAMEVDGMTFCTEIKHAIEQCSLSDMEATVGGAAPPAKPAPPPLTATSRLAFITGLGGALSANGAGGTGPAGLGASLASALNQAFAMPTAQAAAANKK